MHVRGAVYLVVALAVGGGCRERPDREPPRAGPERPPAPPGRTADPVQGNVMAPPAEPDEEAVAASQALLAEAIKAHGGADRLQNLEGYKAETRGVRFGAVPFTGTKVWRSPESMVTTMNIAGATETFGATEDACWRVTPMSVVVPCDEEDRKGMDLEVRALQAERLTPLQGELLRLAGRAAVDGVDALLVEWQDITLAFHPATKRLLRMAHPGRRDQRLGTFVKTYVAHRDVEGAQVATRVVTTFDGAPHLEEELTEITPGAADEELMRPPEQVADGRAVHALVPRQVVAWTEHLGSSRGIHRSVGKLLDFASGRGLYQDPLGGVVVTAMHDGEVPDREQRYRVTVVLRAASEVAPIDEGPMHVAPVPATPVAGVFHVGAYDRAIAKVEDGKRLLAERGLTPAAGARWQIVAYHFPEKTPDAERVALVQIPVVQAPGGDGLPVHPPLPVPAAP